MHICVHSWTIHVLNREWVPGMSRLALTCVANHVPSSTDPKFWSTQRRLSRHANRCFNVISSGIADNVLMSHFMHSPGLLYNYQGKLAEAEMMCQRALRGKEKALGAEHISTLGTVNNLGLSTKLRASWLRQRRCINGLYKGRRKHSEVGTAHVSTLNNLGALYRGQGKLAEAEKRYQRALQGPEKAFGVTHIYSPQLRHSLQNSGQAD
jgi:tetratricopeptide (TPR) repeat protein